MRRRFRPLLNAFAVIVLAMVITAPAAALAIAPPSLAMSFSPTTIGLNGTTTLTFTAFNPEGNPTLSGLAFTHTLPAGLSVANGSRTVCFDGSGTLTMSGGHTLAFSGASLPETWQCQFSVTVTGTALGVFNNTTGPITSANGGTGNTASAALEVVAPPTIAMVFGTPVLAQGTSTSLTFTITNPNSASTLTGIGFADAFPGGLVVAYPNGLTGSCGGGTITADPSSSAVSLGGASLGPDTSCTFSVDVIGAADGVQTTTTGNVTSTEGGPGGTATASITVGTPPSIGITFSPSSILPNGTTTLNFGLYNPETSSTDLTGVTFTDTLPGGLGVVNGSMSVCPVVTFDGSDFVTTEGTVTLSGGNTITLTGLSLPVSWGCSFSVDVSGPAAAGDHLNTTSVVTSDAGIPGNSATAILNVLTPPTIAMAFQPGSITLGAHAALEFTVTNPPGNAIGLTGVEVAVSLPVGLTVANVSSSVCGGTLTTSGGDTISLSAATVDVGSVCTFAVDVSGTALGSYTTLGGTVISANAGTGNTVTTSVVVLAVAPTPTPPADPTASPTLAPSSSPSSSAATTLPPTSTGQGEGPGGSDPMPPMLLLVALLAGSIGVWRVGTARQYPDLR